MASSRTSRWFLIAGLLLGFISFSYSMSKPLTKPVLVEFVQIDYKEDARAIVIDFVVPDIDAIKDLSRIELLISNNKNEAIFAVMLNYGDRLDPIPPGSFGVINDPSSDDRSIKNVSDAAGIPGRWDHNSSNATLLKQSTRSVIGGNLGISIWIVPKDWDPDRYVIKTRVVQRKHSPAPWQELAEFDYTGTAIGKVTQNRCLVKPIFINVSDESVMPFDHVTSVALIRYERKKQDEGVVVKRWAGDTSGQYKYVDKERQELKLSDLSGGLMSLEPGIYQFKHNSVDGRPPSGFYGESNVFEIKEGEEIIKIKVFLNPAI